MAGAPGERLRMEKMRGLHDFPESAPVGSASVARNVEFRYGGVSSRKGTVRLVDVWNRLAAVDGVEDPAEKNRGQGLWAWQLTDGTVVVVIAYIDHQGGAYVNVYDTGGNRLMKRKLQDHTYGAAIDMSVHNGNERPWTGVVYQPGYQSNNYFLLTVPSSHAPAATMWVIGRMAGGTFMLGPVVPIDRAAPADRYWGSWVDLGVNGDDARPYLAGSLVPNIADDNAGDPNNIEVIQNGRVHQRQLSATSMVVYRERVVVGGNYGIGDIEGTREAGAIRWNNVGDLAVGINGSGGPFGTNNARNPDFVWGRMGWPANNIVFFTQPDPSPVTGLAVWRDFLLVFKQRSINMCRFSGINDFVKLQVTQGAGTVANRTVKNVPRTAGGMDVVVFLSEDGVYAWDGEPKYISRAIELRLRRLRQHFKKAWAVVYPEANQYWLVIPETTEPPRIVTNASDTVAPSWTQPPPEATAYPAATKTHLFILDYVDGKWSEYEFPGELKAGDAVPDILGATRVTPVTLREATQYHDERWDERFGFQPRFHPLQHLIVQVHDTGGVDDGDGIGKSDVDGVVGPAGGWDGFNEPRYLHHAISAEWVSQRWRYNFHQVRRWVHVRLTMGENGDTRDNIRFFWQNDNQTKQAAYDADQSRLISGNGLDGSTFGTMTFGNATFSEDGYVTKRVATALGGPCRHFRFGFITAGPHGFHVTSAEADTRRKPGRR